jgi:hypothetical protein
MSARRPPSPWLSARMTNTQCMLRLRDGVTHADLAQLLADGARGVNQSLPPLPAADLPERYRVMFAAILFGSIKP